MYTYIDEEEYQTLVVKMEGKFGIPVSNTEVVDWMLEELGVGVLPPDEVEDNEEQKGE